MKSIICGIMAALLLLTLTSCGGGGSGGGLNLTGNLTLNANLVSEGGGRFHVEATSVYTHPTKDATGVELTFLITYRSTNPATTFIPDALTVHQSNGGVTFTGQTVTQRVGEEISADVYVSTGDLKQFRRLSIPGLTHLSASTNFVNLSTALTQTVTFSGSVAPFSIVTTSKFTGLSVSMNSPTLTISVDHFNHLAGLVRVRSSSSPAETIDINFRF